MENFNDMLGKMTEFLKSEAKTETVIGQQFQLGEFMCVPVMSFGLGLGGGAGEGKNNGKNTGAGEGIGSGAGAGLGISPVGFLVSRGNDIQFIPTRSSKGLGAAFEKIPDLLEKYLGNNKKKETEKV
ncbi:GerW family sporulation protein [Daejeonella oryzae]|uniref:GerW family sporulation protein n=1 Tax=Daejeonella oryzae TaxID=1122943 RepID=UPI0004234224|nr:GerW family sporulation protein [Daejeonella oryzae]